MSAEIHVAHAVPRRRADWRDALLKHAARAALALAAFACFWLFVLPVIVVALSSVATQWSGTILPAGYSLRWFARLGSPEYDALLTSLEIGFGVAALGTLLGLWLALALEGRDRRGIGAVVDALVMVPNGVPSVVLGLAVLIAYHQKPVDLSSSAAIVVLVQLALILPFCYRCAAAALRPELTVLREAAASLGAPPAMVLRRVLLPQLVPALRASLALGFALSLGELGATLTVYPPGFATVPIVVIGQVERGYYLPASALSLLMLGASLAALLLIAARLPRGTRSAA
ncbi:2-aminoethylphosphonate ABC transport system, membrane component PhnV [Burkholderia multivorans]|uniref:2-aminoethylphosphonate ABC transport system, membrane component PhnV n=1 Tax=Burkholderia multivorans TaxID=87883 RepID=UPI000CFF807E|nr:2-aminoethylphosphonate ABC transport system, membrane component PhnV [Burkholderia multivorans]MBR8244361.1 2-aminoethylphosphonate ABC transport system, membrane component PhnV [Burkholderia multivorans]MDR9176808.1 putative 2-aminoethylphosphonate transport system permease protein PhnV [Burkholderia multivorans]MDR9183725.1 putative 2-aminoethylphosphonate transport system permease protein PhnV [Burkholderia multivorans]MDR9189415.1 putative 2-aminoethylphosphonate transport system permea